MRFNPLNPSTMSLKNQSLKKNLTQSVLTPQLPEFQKYDTSKLFEEFKRCLLRQDRKELNKNSVLNNGYKNIICEIRKAKDQKKKQLEKLCTKAQPQLIAQTHIKSKSTKNLLQDIKNCQSHVQTTLQESNIPITQDFSNCKFKPIRPMTSETKFRVNNGKSRATNNQSVEARFGQEYNSTVTINNSKVTKISQTQGLQRDLANGAQKSLPEISQSILLVQMEESQLEDEIFSLKQSLNKLKKQLETVKKELEIETRNEEKYKHISYLATSIKNQTDYIKLQNAKGFNVMAHRQDETLAQLKKFKTNLKKEKDDMETEYIEDINQWVAAKEESNNAKNRQQILSEAMTPRQSEDAKTDDKKLPQKKFELISKTFIEAKNSKSTSVITRSMKKLIDQLDTIVDLLQKNQETFEQIKERECTKVRLGKINKSLLSKERVQILEKIEDFQEKYDMKIGSVQNLILRVYHSLFNSNKILESECLNLTHTKEQLEIDLKEIEEKHKASMNSFENSYKMIESEEIERKKTNEILKKNSIVFLRIIEVFYTILYKFRYMFSLALTLDIDKKSFRDCIIQIDSCFSSGVFFNFNYDKHLITSTQRHDIINEKEFREILMDKKIDAQMAMEMTENLFNDHRINLILHKSWIESKLKYLMNGEVTESDLLDIIETVRMDCEQIYLMRLPVLARLFLTCFKSVSMTKYESKLVASSHERESIFLPTGKTKKLQFLQTVDENCDSFDKDSEMSSYEPSKKKITFKTESENAKEDQVFEKDPRKIIYHLEEIKGRSYKKFKALNFSCEGKAYKYNEQIVIPDFPMVWKEDDF